MIGPLARVRFDIPTPSPLSPSSTQNSLAQSTHHVSVSARALVLLLVDQLVSRTLQVDSSASTRPKVPVEIQLKVLNHLVDQARDPHLQTSETVQFKRNALL